MPFLSKVSNNIQNIFCLYDVTGFTQLWHSIPVATKCNETTERIFVSGLGQQGGVLVGAGTLSRKCLWIGGL